MGEKDRTSIHLTKSEIRKLRILAIAYNTSFNDQLEKAIEVYLNNNEKSEKLEEKYNSIEDDNERGK